MAFCVFYMKTCFYFAHAQFICKRSISFDVMAKKTPYQYSTDAKYIIRNVYTFHIQEKEDGLKISPNQAKERTFTMTWVSKSTIERLMKRDNTKEEKPEQPRTKSVQLDDFEVRRACFVSKACILVIGDSGRGRA